MDGWTWCIILLEEAIKRWVHCGHKGTEMVSNNSQVGCGIQTMLNWYSGAQSVQYFSQLDNKVLITLCGMKPAYHGSTRVMRTHLLNHYQYYVLQEQKEQVERQQKITGFVAAKRSCDSKQQDQITASVFNDDITTHQLLSLISRPQKSLKMF